MDLTLAETATLLGKSERQIRYLIRQEQLEARKEGKRWIIASEKLALTTAQREQLGERVDRARDAFEKAVAPAAKTATKARKVYSITDLDAFRIGTDLLRAARNKTTGDTHAAELLYTCLEELGRGCHEFQPKLKSARFAESRDAAARAAVHLLIETCPNENPDHLGRRIEAELIPKLSGLVASQEKRIRRRGSGRPESIFRGRTDG